MSGKRRGPVASLMRGGLWCVSKLYGIGVAFRNRSFDRQRREICEAEVPVISVGNLTTGGTGKTPIVAYLARWFRDHQVRVAIVSRGYGRGDADENDEAAELHQRLPDVPHVQDPDRVEAARIAVEELESQVIIMDDGFQHRRLGRDLDIVLIDATCPFGYSHLLPRGLLREPIRSLIRADLVLLTRCDQVDDPDLLEIESVVRTVQPDIPILRSTHRPTSLLCHPSKRVPLEWLESKSVGLVCGIGNPQAFARTLADLGASVAAQRLLPDHAGYDPSTMSDLQDWASGVTADAFVCTQKDLVKIQTDRLGGRPLYAVTIDAEIPSPAALVEQLESIRKMPQPSGRED